MRGVHTFINDIRRQVFTEVARMAFEGGNYAKTIRELPYKIIPGEVAKYRQNILVERAVVSERIRLAIGLPLRNVSEYEPTDAYLEDSLVAEKVLRSPADQHHFLCLQRLPHQAGAGDQHVPGLSGPPL